MLVVAVPCHRVRGQSGSHHTARRRPAEAIVHVRDKLVSSHRVVVIISCCPSSHDPFPSDVSRQSEIFVSCYLRKEEPKRGNDGVADDMGNDIFLGGVRVTPDFDDMPVSDQWYDLSGDSGRIQMGMAFRPSTVRRLLLLHLHLCLGSFTLSRFLY